MKSGGFLHTTAPTSQWWRKIPRGNTLHITLYVVPPITIATSILSQTAAAAQWNRSERGSVINHYDTINMEMALSELGSFTFCSIHCRSM